jgi:hypothetical protein
VDIANLSTTLSTSLESYPQSLCKGLLGVVVGGSATMGVQSVLRHSERSERNRAFPQASYRAVDNFPNCFPNLEQVFDDRFGSKLHITPLGVWHPRKPDDQASEGRLPYGSVIHRLGIVTANDPPALVHLR